MITAETMLKILGLIISIIGIAGVLVQFMQFTINIHSQRLQRERINLGATFAASPCFTLERAESLRKGVFDVEKLKECNISYPRDYLLVISNRTCLWKLGNKTLIDNERTTYPIAIKGSDGLVKPANLTVYFGGTANSQYKDVERSCP